MVNESQRAASPAESNAQSVTASAPSLTGRRALVVEDDAVLARFLERMLRAQGLEVELAYTGDGALAALSPELDLVILDLNLPGMDGISVLQQLRQRFLRLPVLVLTGRSRTDCSVLALDSGADDCLTKPFSCAELIARLRAISRRSALEDPKAPQKVLHDLALQPDEFRAIRDGIPVHLTPREFGLLEYLMRSPGKAVPRAVLLKELWGDESQAGSNIVDVYMKYVRDKIDLPGLPKLIRTVRGVGYAIGEASNTGDSARNAA